MSDWSQAPGATVDLPPRSLGEGARGGRVDAGLMATADWFGLDPQFEIVGPYGITCRGPVSSVLLFARQPFAELFVPGAGPRTVDLTTESQTSVALTKILLADRFGARDLTYVRRAVEADAAPTGDAWLLIGDAALRARHAAAADPTSARARPGRRVARVDRPAVRLRGVGRAREPARRGEGAAGRIPRDVARRRRAAISLASPPPRPPPIPRLATHPN